MKIQTKNFEELILSLICISGEVDEKYLFERFTDSILNPYEYTYAKRTLRDMQQARLINKKEYQKLAGKEKYLRLSSVAGDDAVCKISEELLPHFFLMAGDENNRYKGSANRLRRKRDTMHLTLTHILDGIMVDYFTLEHIGGYGVREESEMAYRQSIFDRHGKLLHPKEIIARLDKSDVCYFTSGALKGMHKAVGIFKGNTKYCGILFAPPKSFVCYYVPFYDYTWTATEEQLKLVVKSYASEISGSRTRPPAAIFYMPDTSLYYDYINPPAEKKKGRGCGRRMNPAEVYDNGYILPLSENYSEIREFLLMENGETLLSKIVLEENYVSDKSYDGMVKGCKIYNLLLSDFCKIQRIRERVREEDSIIVIHKWQEETMRKYFGEETRIITISKDDFSEYLMRSYSY